MPEANGVPPGTLVMLVLRVLQNGPLHGYAIAQRIHALSSDVLKVEEGSLYPALQRILIKGWAKAEWGVSETNRRVRFYRLTPAGRAHLAAQMADYERTNAAIAAVLRTASGHAWENSGAGSGSSSTARASSVSCARRWRRTGR